MSENKKYLKPVLFYGGLWGLAEATLGYLLHLFPTGVAGIIMFPVAFYLMFNLYKSSGMQSGVLMAGCIAAGIKLTGLAIPLQSPISVINPAVSILLESLVIFAFVTSTANRERVYVKTFAMTIIHIGLLVLVQTLIFRPAEGLYLLPVLPLGGYILLSGIVGSLMMGTWLRHPVGVLSLDSLRLSYLQPGLLILVAILLEAGTRLI
ncbi:MAG: hypothetical protein J7K63_02825 [Candidatus Marinimicrobia bacterium]|nr:hypothetical protein [Candidatus Neomarinimicrobiota bacterium]